jgi:hypothetical protein
MIRIENKFQLIYEKKGPSAVYDLANKLELPYLFCKPCNAETPVIGKDKICGCCGQ